MACGLPMKPIVKLPGTAAMPSPTDRPSPRRLALALALIGAAHGSGSRAAEPVELPEVVVHSGSEPDGSAASGYRLPRVGLGPLGELRPQDAPFSIGTVSGEQLRNQQASNTGEALKYLPTVYTNTGASQITPYFTLRGFTASTWTANMALDGMRSFAVYEALDDKAALEVLNGAAGFLYGITSPAGMINYVSKRPSPTPLATLGVGLYDRQLYATADFGGPLGSNGDLAYRLNLGYGDPGRSGVEHQSQERSLVSGNLDWRVNDDLKLGFEASHAHRRLDYAQALFMTTAAIGIPRAPASSDNWGAPYSFADDTTARLGARAEWRLDEVFKLRAQLRYTDSERAYLLNRQVWQNAALDYKWRVDANAGFHTTVAQANLFLDAEFASGPLRHKVSGGVSADDFDAGDNGYRGTTYATVYPGNLYATPGYRAWSQPPAGTSSAERTHYRSALLSDRIGLGEHWEVLLGLTRASIDSATTATTAAGVATTSDYDQARTTPALSLIYRPLPALSTYLSYNEALQKGFIAPAGTANAGSAFAPFVGRQKEAGAKAGLAGIELALAWFTIEQANQYVDPATNLASQAGRETHRGWEFSAGGRLGRYLAFGGGFTALTARIDRAAANFGKTPQGVPELMARLFVEYDLPGVPGLTLTGGVSHTGKLPWDAANTLYVDAVTLFDAGLRYRQAIAGQATTWRLNVANLTDRDYWTTRSGILYPGAPRLLALSATVDF